MKRLLSTFAATVLLLGLGALAYLALPHGAHDAAASAQLMAEVVPGAVSTAAAGAQAAVPSAEPLAALAGTDAVLNWKDVAIPLDVETIVDAQSLAGELPAPQNILLWNAAGQSFFFYVPDPVFPGGLGDHPDFANGNYALGAGDSLFVLSDAAPDDGFPWVGEVPPPTGSPGAVAHSLVGANPCLWNHVMIPLDHSAITTAQQLADAVGDVDNVLVWNSQTQAFNFYVPDPVYPGGLGDHPGFQNGNFAARAGNPYWLCMTNNKTWPQ